MAAAIAALLAIAIAVFVVLPGGGTDDAPDLNELFAECLAQAEPEAEAEREAESGSEREAESEAERESGSCSLRKHPETFTELSLLNGGLAARVAADSPSELLEAARVRDELGAPTAAARVPGTGGRWRPVGRGPLHADDPDYPSAYGAGFAELAGRIADYAYDKRHGVVYAAVASGGVWRSRDVGEYWRSIGDRLPTQTVGSIAYSRARGGTLVALTGDNAFGGNTYGGLGAFYSTDGGRSWHRSRGIPAGAMGFKAAVDPTSPRVIYAATGAGLFRSGDAGRRFRNVNLPTGPCRGNSFRRPNCFFANVVSDVVVQAPDEFGNEGGSVLAAVGWRAGARSNFNGRPDSPANGLYLSKRGRPGTFKRLDVDTNGFAPQARVGRVELGAATGPAQNHDYVYAIVQDAVLFNSGKLVGLDVPDVGLPVDPIATPTYLNGVYVSADFGKTWTKMLGTLDILLPTSGSTLAQLTPLGFGPGIQSWYNEWIQPDPTRQLGGVPTRLVFGLEEIFQNTLPLPQNGPGLFKTIGPYNANGGPCLLVLASDICSDIQQATPDKLTTHPDQHAGRFVPDGEGGVTLLAGGDGGNYTQHTGPNGDFGPLSWGKGDQLGFHTLLPYGVTASRDGVVYAGLQDNGQIRIEPGGYQAETYGGDGIFTVAHPRNSDIVYEEVPEAGVSVSTDGGRTWASIDPFVDNASFYAPLVMDPRNPKHLLTGGRQIVETTDGPATTSPDIVELDTDWATVFNLGESKHEIPNQVSAIGVRGPNVYAGYCGGCDPVRDNTKFFAGLATNVGGKKRPRPETRRGWHKVKAKGLPQRFISSVAIDPRRKRTVYVTLGASSLRPYAPPKAGGPSGLSGRGGHVYKSTNAGRSFHDISANIRRLPALWAMVRRGQLLVATTNGVYASRDTDGGRYALLGRNLPPAPVFSLAPMPGKSRQILAASLGRGVYRYTFPRGR